MVQNKAVKPSLTPEQQSVIDERNKNLLVSASAGSGKTFVMIKRIIEMIKAKETKVEEILVVTFTKAAASEMKERLVKGLEEVEPKDGYILEQLSNVNMSSISTLHSFCAKLLKTYFYVLGLDPSFILIDEIEASALKSKALSRLIDGRFKVGDKTFFELLDIFSINRNEDNFRQIILKLYDYLLTQVNDEEWFKESTTKSYELDLNKNQCTGFINDVVSQEFHELKTQADYLLQSLSRANEPKLVEVINSIYVNLLKINRANGFIKNGVRLTEFEKVKSIPSKVKEGVELLKEEVKIFKAKYNSAVERAEKYLLFDTSGKIKERLDITKKRVQAIFEYTKLFKEIYDSLKKEKVALDFADLEEYTLKLLENPEVKKEVQDKYKYVFVDEYQDTNLIQEVILSKITRGDNLFMVGDVKQSIYKFRASEPEIFVSKYRNYSEGKNIKNRAIDLNHNFRSHQDILEFSNFVFNRNMTNEFGQVDYFNTAQLKKGDKEYPKVSTLPIVQLNLVKEIKQEKQEIVEKLPVYSVKNHPFGESEQTVKKAECEGEIIAEQIKQLVGQEIYLAKQQTTKKIEYSDIAILTASRGAYLELVLKQLEAEGIPYSSDIELGVFIDSYVGTIRSFLELLVNPNQDMRLISVMNSKMFDFDINDLADIRRIAPDVKFYYQAVDEAYNSDKTPAKLKSKLNKFKRAIDYYRFLSKFLRVDELIDTIIKETGFLSRITVEVDGAKTVGLINKLLTFLVGKSYNLNLAKFLDYIKDNEIKFGMEESAGGVQVTTIHKSKGLEYPVVILMGAGQPLLKRNRGEFLISKQFGAGIDFYDNKARTKQKTVVKNAIILEADRAEKEERLRLLYVALTRAVNHLIIVGCVKGKEEVAPSGAECFLDWILPAVEEAKRKGKSYCVKYFLTEDIKASEMTTSVVNEVRMGEGSFAIQERFDKFISFKYPYLKEINSPVKTTVSEILKRDEMDYLTPIEFSEKSEIAIRKGVIYHTILSKIDLTKNSVDEFNKEIEKLVKKNELSKEDLNLFDLGEIFQLLNNAYFKDLVKFPILREQEFILMDESKSDGVILQGIVDLIVLTDKGVVILDYKTNNSYKEDFYREKYKKQLDLYAKAVEGGLNQKVIKKLLYSFKMKKFIEV